jgi:hypothetical protein
LPRPTTSRPPVTRGRPPASGSASRTRCTGRGCGSPAHRGGAAGRSRARGGRRGIHGGPPRSRPGSAKWGDDLGLEDGPVVVEPVAVPEHPSRSLGPAIAGAGSGRHVDGRPVGLVVGGDDPQRLVERVWHSGPRSNRQRGPATGVLQACAIAAIRSRLYQAGVKPWTLAPWARTRSVSASSLDALNATMQRTGCTSAHRTSRVCSPSGLIECPFLGHLSAGPTATCPSVERILDPDLCPLIRSAR